MKTPKRRAGGKTRAGASRKRRVQRRIEPLARSLVALRAEAEGLGVFAGDRELLECPTCGLREDVLSDGRLVTYRGAAVKDTGLRFIETSNGCFTCPSCGREILLSEPK